MGIYLKGIIVHQLNKEEIFHLPEEIEKWDEVRILKMPAEHISFNFLEEHEQQMKKITHWAYYHDFEPDKNIDESVLENIWQYYETDGKIRPKIDTDANRIRTFFGALRIFRHTIEIDHSPEGKYSNLMTPKVAKMILQINRVIASKFGCKEILYCPES